MPSTGRHHQYALTFTNPEPWNLNDFALARPFCESIKSAGTGELGWRQRRLREGAPGGVSPAAGTLNPMGAIGRYVFRTTMGAFVLTCVSLAIVMWFTQAIREFDLITSQRQTAFVFVGLTGLFFPLLVMMIAPISLVLAAAHVLNKLSSDSEIIVMNAAGLSPWRLLLPLMAAAAIVSLLVATLAAYVSPMSLRKMRDWATEVRADILSNIVQPGHFATLGGNVTFHIADRRPNGILLGIFLDDRRDPNEHSTYLAEQGEIVKNDVGSFLVLERGSAQRVTTGETDPRIVTFQRYAFDLSKFSGGPQTIVYSTREKDIWDLLWPRANDRQYKEHPNEFRSELHDRYASPLYPFVFVILAYAFLGPPQTTRQSRAMALVGLTGAVSLLRLLGFLSVIVGQRVPAVLAVQYVALGGAAAAGLWHISHGRAIEPTEAMTKFVTMIGDRFARATAS
jgi:lipopolysaccharide export system permease protein